jgi:hypothetical protein
MFSAITAWEKHAIRGSGENRDVHGTMNVFKENAKEGLLEGCYFRSEFTVVACLGVKSLCQRVLRCLKKPLFCNHYHQHLLISEAQL